MTRNCSPSAWSAGPPPTTGCSRRIPKNDKPLHDAVAYAQHLLPETTSEPIADFWEQIDGLMYGDEAVMGRIKDSTYYHGGLRVVIDFPGQWTIANPQGTVSAAAPGGREEAFIEVGRHPWQKRQSPERFLRNRLQRDDITSGEPVEINGMEGFLGETATEGTDARLKLIGVLYRAKDVFLFSGTAGPNGDPEAFRKDFLATMHALRNMTPEDAAGRERQAHSGHRRPPGPDLRRSRPPHAHSEGFPKRLCAC